MDFCDDSVKRDYNKNREGQIRLLSFSLRSELFHWRLLLPPNNGCAQINPCACFGHVLFDLFTHKN